MQVRDEGSAADLRLKAVVNESPFPVVPGWPEVVKKLLPLHDPKVPSLSKSKMLWLAVSPSQKRMFALFFEMSRSTWGYL